MSNSDIDWKGLSLIGKYYQIVKSDTIERLGEICEKGMDQGYVPSGGIFHDDGSGSSGYYFQVMFKR